LIKIHNRRGAHRAALRGIARAVTLMLLAAPAAGDEQGWDLGGAVRFNYNQNDYSESYDGAGKLDFDTARINIDYRRDALTGSFEDRDYQTRAAGDDRFIQSLFDGDATDSHFLHHAWIGWQIDPQQEVQIGMNKVPFGGLPFASHSYFFQLPYYVGL